MKIYIVIESVMYEGDELCGIFLTEEKAKLYMKETTRTKDDLELFVYEPDCVVDQSFRLPKWFLEIMDANGIKCVNDHRKPKV